MRVEPRLSAHVRCAYCHGHLGPVFNRCATCRTALHLDCWAQLPTCPTLGCGGVLGGAPKGRNGLPTWVLLAGSILAALAGGLLTLTLFSSEETPTPPAQSVPAVALEAEPGMLRHVLAATESPEVSLRLGAVISLGKTGGEGAAEALAQRAANDSDVRVRLYAAQGLSRVLPHGAGVAETGTLLERALLREQADEVRIALVQAWGFQRGHLGLRQLGPILRSDPNRAVRLATAEAIATIFANTNADDARRLLERATNDRSWQVRQAAQRGLDAAQAR